MSFQSFRGKAISVAGMIALVGAHVALAAQAADASGPPLDPRIDKILDRLEARQIRDIRADVSWTLMHVITEDKTIKRGKLYYRDAKPAAKFLVHFEKINRDGRNRKVDERHLFDGRWYTERSSKTKLVTRREIRRESDLGNPYRIGEGVFPLPFGQKKADILAEFTVSLVPPKKGDPKQTDHLKLIPRPGTRTARTYASVDFWIRQAGVGKHPGLPVKVKVEKKDGAGRSSQHVIVEVSNVAVNTGLSDSTFKIGKPLGYSEQIDRLPPEKP